ncbi:MAG TPA: glycosyltransferase family 4 protein [Planctomycetaceae bacterium]|nr:glycosyltransferase family 4 protein [Planctomycetaceae bacterium]
MISSTSRPLEYRPATGPSARGDEPRVLLLAGRFSLRGSCAYTLRLAEALPEANFRVAVACPDAQMVEPEMRRHLGIWEFPYLQTPVWGRVVLSMMARTLAKAPPDLIHVQIRNAASQGAWLARRLKRPYILTVHDYLQGRQRLIIDRQWCRRVIAVSESVKADLLNQTGLPEELVQVIHSGVDCDDCGEATPVLEPGRVPVVGTAGPLEAVKGFPFFLGAAARVLATGRDVEFVIAGAGPEEENLRRITRELGIVEHVTFVPNLLDFDDALEAMDVFCLPSLQQGIGTTMLEAMALGRPVIATRVGGVYRVIRDNETGLLVPPSDSARLAERILELLDDPLRARNIGSAARTEVRGKFGVDRMAAEIAGLYREVLSATRIPEAPLALSSR